MKRIELPEMIDADLIDRIYRYCYARTSCSHEAESLCSDILYAVVKSCHDDREVTNPIGYFWSVARNVYADYCKKRRIQTENTVVVSDELWEMMPDMDTDDAASDAQLLSSIYRQISNLSQAYRKVMIGYYLDGKSTARLAQELSIKETTVRQRLFSARNDVKKGVTKMEGTRMINKPTALQEMRWAEWGTGNPLDGDPREVCKRQMSKHIVWLCRKQPKTAREISDELGVPMTYVEEELEIQVYGTNGRYGMLRKTDAGKYIANCILLDEKEIAALQKLYIDCIPVISDTVIRHIAENKEKYCAFPYINRNPTLNLILWQQISSMADAFSNCVISRLKKKDLADVQPSERPFTVYCYKSGAEAVHWGGGWDGVEASDICGYKHIILNNIYIGRIQPHFHCGYNVSNDAKLRMAIRAVYGLPVSELTEDEREIAAKSIECGYLYREKDVLYTKFLVNKEQDSHALFDTTELLYPLMPAEAVNEVAGKIAEFVRQNVPKHLIGDYRFVNNLASMPVLDTLVEALIDQKILTPPENGIGAEGIWMSVM